MKETIIDSFLEIVKTHPQKEALLYKKDHHYESLTFEQLFVHAQKLAHFLREQGLKEGDRLVLVSENRPEWVIADLGAQMVGAVLVPVHQVLSAVQIESIVVEIKPFMTLVSTKQVLEKVAQIPKTGPILYFEEPELEGSVAKKVKIFSFKKEVFARPHQKQLELVAPKPNRVITIIYTSGTTGEFKGVALTNKNFISNVKDVLTMVEVTSSDKFLSILPLSHVFERTVGYYIALLTGATTSYIEDPSKLSEVAQAEQPTIIIGVPRLLEKVYEKVKEKASVNPVKALVFAWALNVGKSAGKKSGPYRLADKIVFKKIKEAFGGKVRFFVSGSASLAQEIGEFFDALDIPVIEGYGLTETSPILTCNSLLKRKYGTVGVFLPSVKYKIKDGELLVKGPNVFSSYYKKPEKTAEAFTADGWFKTGDLVEVDSRGFVKILAREKEIIALTTGKKVSPAFLEERMQLLPSVSQAFVFGDQRKHVGALIVPNTEKTKGLTKAQKIAKIQQELEELLNNKIAHYEQIKKFVLLSEPFTVENGLLTPSFKLRRKEIEFHYIKEIEGIYSEKPIAVN